MLTQEVTAAAFADLRRRFEWGVYSLELWGDRVREISPNKHGVAVVGSSQLAPRRCYLVEHFAAPWKMLAADLALTHHRGYFTAVSYHALNGQCGQDGFDKPRLTLQVADWLEHQPQPVVLGMDANSPTGRSQGADPFQCDTIRPTLTVRPGGAASARPCGRPASQRPDPAISPQNEGRR